MTSPFGNFTSFKRHGDEERLWNPVFEEIQRIIGESLNEGSLPEEEAILHRLQAVVPSEEEVARPKNIILETAHLVGVKTDIPQPDILGNTLRANAYLVRRIIENRLNLVELKKKSLHLPEDAKLEGATVRAFILDADGEKREVKMGKYSFDKAVIGSGSYSERILQAMQLVAQMNISDEEKERVLSACLPRIQKNEAGVQFYFPDGRFMFGVSNRGGVIARSVLRKQDFCTAYYELMAASYAVERSDKLDEEEKGRIQTDFFDIEKEKDGNYSIRFFNASSLGPQAAYKPSENKLQYYFGAEDSRHYVTAPLELDFRNLLSLRFPIGELRLANTYRGRDSNYSTYFSGVSGEDQMSVEFDRLGHIASIRGNDRDNNVPIKCLLDNLAYARRHHNPLNADVNRLHSLLNAIEIEIVPAEAEGAKNRNASEVPDELVVRYIENPQDETVLADVIEMIKKIRGKDYMGPKLAHVSTVYEILLDHPKTSYEMLRARIFDKDEYDEIKTRCVEVIRVRFPEECEKLVKDLFKAYEEGDMKTTLLLVDWKEEANVGRLIELVQSGFSCPDAVDTLYAVGTEKAIDVIFKVGLSTPELRRRSAERIADLSERQKGLSIEHEILVVNAMTGKQFSNDGTDKHLIKALRGALTREASIALYKEGSVEAYEALTTRHEKEKWVKLPDWTEFDREVPGSRKMRFSTHHTGVFVGGGGPSIGAPRDYGMRTTHLATISGAGYKLATWKDDAYLDRMSFDFRQLRDRVHELGLEVMEKEHILWDENQEKRLQELLNKLYRTDHNQSKQRLAKVILIILKGCGRVYKKETMDQLHSLANNDKPYGGRY